MRIDGRRRRGDEETLSFIAHAQAEVENLVAVRDVPHAVQLHAVYVTEEHVDVVMEWARGGSVRDAMHGAGGGRMAEGDCRVALAGPLTALVGMHRRGLVHFDIKPGNVLLRGALEEGAGVPRGFLGDFGSMKLRSERGRRWGCTRCFAAPEVRSGAEYGVQADAFSFGVLLFELMWGRLPFGWSDEDEEGVLASKMEAMRTTLVHEVVEESGTEMSPSAIHLVTGLLEEDATLRLTCEEALSHPWWGEGRMGDGVAFRGLLPPVGWREPREVEEEEGEEGKEEEEEVEVGTEEGLVEGVGEEEAVGEHVVEEEREEVPPPVTSLPDLEEAGMEGGREKKGSESVPWTWTAVGEVAWWAGAVAAVAVNVGRTLSM